MILTVAVDMQQSATVVIPHTPERLVRELLAKGYDEIDLVGLAQLNNQLRDGRVWDSMPLRVEDDAEFLAQAYLDLRPALSESRPAKHWVYLGDGSFEISAVLQRDGVSVRVGEYRETEGGGPRLMLSEAEYVSVWRSIAIGLMAGLA